MVHEAVAAGATGEVARVQRIHRISSRRPGTFKTKLCRYFERGCKKGDQCDFAHDSQELHSLLTATATAGMEPALPASRRPVVPAAGIPRHTRATPVANTALEPLLRGPVELQSAVLSGQELQCNEFPSCSKARAAATDLKIWPRRLVEPQRAPQRATFAPALAASEHIVEAHWSPVSVRGQQLHQSAAFGRTACGAPLPAQQHPCRLFQVQEQDWKWLMNLLVTFASLSEAERACWAEKLRRCQPDKYQD